jgi:hypothetical protein
VQVSDYLIYVSSRKAAYVTPLGNEMVSRQKLIILQESDVPRLCEMVRVLVETMERILDLSDEDSEEELLADQILAHVQNLINSDPFLPKKKKFRKAKLDG